MTTNVAVCRAAFLLATMTLGGFALFGNEETSPAPTPMRGLPPLKIDHGKITASGQPINLRGINWGWWHLQGTVYSEDDMRHVAQWGANVIRLAFSYNDLENEDPAGTLKEEGFGQLDEVLGWARRYGVYVILDMHVVPGGQSTLRYTAGGHNLLWKDASAQDRFVALWTALARRYRDHPEVAAYDLLNEPNSTTANPDALCRIAGRAINAIRSVDREKIIAVGGDRGSGASALVEALKFPDPNILYTFHWYVGTEDDRTPISLDAAAFQAKMSPAIDFARKFNVPVWVGEFGCEAADKKYQARWVTTSIAAFEAAGFSWTYWNDRETSAPNGMALQAERKDGTDEPINDTLLGALRTGWALNDTRK